MDQDHPEHGKRDRVQSLSPFQKAYGWIEAALLAFLVPRERPGPIWRWLFKTPVLLYRLGLGPWIGRYILLLETTGRVTGKKRVTPLEYQSEPASDAPLVMAGWGGRTDWYRNARAHPRVRVRVGKNAFSALAQPVAQEEMARFMMKITQLNPGMLKVWSRWAGFNVLPVEESILRAAAHFPGLRLVPEAEPILISQNKTNRNDR
jgi:deazaflavin-dependent oxidoreductase (nitroreductase family)